MTRKECLVNICKLVDAIKLKSYATKMPTMEEAKYYGKISKLLSLDNLICSAVKDEDLEIACRLDKGLAIAGYTVDKYLDVAGMLTRLTLDLYGSETCFLCGFPCLKLISSAF